MMLDWIVLGLLFLVVASYLAIFEVEIEGPNGWATGLPTPQLKKGPISSRYYRAMGGKPLTGYHLLFFPFVLVFYGLLYHCWWTEIHGQPWQGHAWWPLFSQMATLCASWDFLWFVINPYFGLARFKKEFVWWHAQDWWVFGLFPSAYLWANAGAFIIISLGAFFSKDLELLNGPLVVLATAAIGVTLIVFTGVKPYHWWYFSMRKPEAEEASA
jgi:hypothetical protein